MVYWVISVNLSKGKYTSLEYRPKALTTLAVDLFFTFASAARYPRRGVERAIAAIKAKNQAVDKFWEVFFPKKIYVFG